MTAGRGVAGRIGRADLADVGDLADRGRGTGQHDDLVSHCQRLVHRVRHEQERRARPLDDPVQLLLEPRPREHVEASERLVHQQHRRIERECARDGDTLLHPSRKLVRIPVCGSSETRQLHELPCPLGGSAPLPAVHTQRIGDVVEHRSPREELVELLEHDSAIGAWFQPLASCDLDPTARRADESGDSLEQGRLTASGGADDDRLLAGRHLERGVGDRERKAVLRPVAELDLLHAQYRRARGAGGCRQIEGRAVHSEARS